MAAERDHDVRASNETPQRHHLEHSSKPVSFTIRSQYPAAAGGVHAGFCRSRHEKISDALSLELFVRVAHMRVLWLATIETLLLRRLLNMEDITLLADNCRDAAASLARGGTPMHAEVAQRCEADINDFVNRFASSAI